MRHERKRAAQGHVDSTGAPKSRSKFAVLRTAAVSHKGRHRGPRSTSSQHRGVTQHRRTKKWEAHIWDARKQMYLGGYSTEEEAARAHDIMALKCRGLDSTLNYDKKDYAFLEDKLDSMSKDDVRIRLLGKDSRLSCPSWSAEHQAHEEDEHHIIQQQQVMHSPQIDLAEGTTTMQQDMHRNQIPLPDSFVAIDEDIFFSDDADADASVDNDSATSDVCSLAEPILQDWTKPNKHVTNKGVPKDMLSHAQSPLLPDDHFSARLTIDSSPTSNFGHPLSAGSHLANDTATDLLQQSLYMHTANKAQYHVEPGQYYCSTGSSSLFSATAPASSMPESDMYSRTRQLLDMPASTHNALHKDIINGPRALLRGGTQRPCMPKYTHHSSFNTCTDSIGNKSLSSRIMSNPHVLSAEALTSAWSGQRLETRCTSTGHSNFATCPRADVYKPPTASDGQAIWQERYPRPMPNLAFSLADQAFKPSMAQPVGTSKGFVSAQQRTSIPDGLRDYIAPSSPVLLPSPRQPLFLASFNLQENGFVPFPSTPPWYSSMHSPSIPARSSEHVRNSAEIYKAYAQEAQFRGIHLW